MLASAGRAGGAGWAESWEQSLTRRKAQFPEQSLYPWVVETGPHSLLALPGEEYMDSRMGTHHSPSLPELPTGASSLPAHRDLGFPLLPRESSEKGEAWLWRCHPSSAPKGPSTGVAIEWFLGGSSMGNAEML